MSMSTTRAPRIDPDAGRRTGLAPLATIDGWPITLADEAQTVGEVIAAAGSGEGFAVFTLNLDHLVKLRREPRFRHAYRIARYITADGAPVARLARWQDTTIMRTTGADLVEPLSAAAAAKGLSVYLFGTSPEVLARAGRELAERTDFALDIAGSASPGRDFDPEGPEADAALERIAASGAKLCFVALGAPKQEVFAARAVEKGVKVGFVCIGAALDFLAGAQIRAPRMLRSNGLEWLWRLVTSPRRLATRYVRCAVVLADIVLLAPLKVYLPTHRT
ncbi:MAG: WecB/TagA/CpsF family glycosyltransferase [Hyphomicrobium sp.]